MPQDCAFGAVTLISEAIQSCQKCLGLARAIRVVGGCDAAPFLGRCAGFFSHGVGIAFSAEGLECIDNGLKRGVLRKYNRRDRHGQSGKGSPSEKVSDSL